MTLEELRKTSFHLLLKLDLLLYGQPNSEEIRVAHNLAQQLHREIHERAQNQRVCRTPDDMLTTIASGTNSTVAP